MLVLLFGCDIVVACFVLVLLSLNVFIYFAVTFGRPIVLIFGLDLRCVLFVFSCIYCLFVDWSCCVCLWLCFLKVCCWLVLDLFTVCDGGLGVYWWVLCFASFIYCIVRLWIYSVLLLFICVWVCC